MDSYVTGNLIKKIREEKGLTQAQLGGLIFVSEKTISKWETGKGLPDISLLEPLTKALEVSISELITGTKIENTNIQGNMLNVKFYVCPICHNVIASIGECQAFCHGISLPSLEAESSDIAKFEKVEDEIFVSISHEMSKENYISFIAGVSNERIEIVKMYPESNAECRLKIRGLRYIYFYEIKNGLFKQKVIF